MSKNNDMKTSQKFLIVLIDIVAIFAIAGIIYLAFSNDGYNSNLSPNIASDNSENITSELSLENQPITSKEDDIENNIENDDSAKEDIVSENSVSEDSVSEDSASENSVSEDSVSEDSVSDDNVKEKLYSYAIPGAPSIMNSPSGTVIDISALDLNNIGNYFIIMDIPDDIFEYINGKSYQENENIQLSDLRYIKVLHYNYQHGIQIGEIIVNEAVAKEIKDIFMTLFISQYEIQSMYLPDRYWTGDGNTTDTASCDANNTSGFFYRTVGGTNSLSKHAMGKAVDINPQQNPYVSYKTGAPVCEHENALAYIDRTTGLDHMITEQDLCYYEFVRRGYTWGGAWNSIKDYQHFEK